MAKIKYKAIYTDPKRNPFETRHFYPVVTAEVEENIPIQEVRRMAKEAGKKRGYIFDSVEKVK